MALIRARHKRILRLPAPPALVFFTADGHDLATPSPRCRPTLCHATGRDTYWYLTGLSRAA